MMNDTPPRRSRRSTPAAQTGTLPFVPIIIGIIVLGFLIGAGLSFVGRGGGGNRPVIANVVPSQSASPPVAPAPAMTPTAVATPSRVDAIRPPPASPADPTSAPATHVPASHAPATDAPATAAPATRVPATPTAKAVSVLAKPVKTPPAAANRSVSPAARVAVAAVARASAAATAGTVARTATGGPAEAPASSDDANSEFAKLASAVVRQYVAAIARGDDTTAYAAFGPGAAGNVKLVESGTLDGSTHIEHVEARGAGDNATVNVDLKTAKGRYFGQYTVHRTESGAALITDHALNRL